MPMHRSIRGIVAAAVALGAGAGHAANYQLVAEALCDGDSATDIGVTSVAAEAVNEDSGGSESYLSAANGGGGLSASAAVTGVPPFVSCPDRAVAKLVETLKLPTAPFPNGPVTISVGMTADIQALTTGGNTADASAVVRLEPFSMTCSAGTSVKGGPGGSCPDGTVQGLSVTRTFSLQELSNRQWEIDVEAQVDATLESFHALGTSNASASAGIYVQVSGGGVESYTWTGTNTNIPTPEPGAGALGLASFASLAKLAARGRRRR